MKTRKKVASKSMVASVGVQTLQLLTRIAEATERLASTKPAFDIMTVHTLDGSRRDIPVPPAVARFVNLGADGKPTSGDHVAVYDTTTGLTWSAGPLLAGKSMNHATAMKACTELDLLGQKDWRAPTVTELLTIVDYERYDPAVDPAHFKGPYGWTWASTPFKGNSGAAWDVGLSNGGSDWSNHSFVIHARAVRAGQALDLGLKS